MVGFEPSEDQKLVQETVRSFAREQIRPRARDADETGEIPAALVEQAWGLGLVQGTVPEAYGGFGNELSAVTGALVAEELGWGDLSIALHILAPSLVTVPLLEFGTEAQKREVLPTYTGENFRAATAALVEPRFGFDPAEMETVAEKKNGGWILRGHKCFVPLADEAEHMLVYARTGGPGLENVGVFLVRRGTPGVEILEREKNMGIKGLRTFEVRLSDVRLPAEARLETGEAGVRRLLDRSRVALAALAVGVSRAAFEYARDYAKERKAFGVAIAQKQAIAFMVAEMAIEIDATRLLVWEAAWKLDRGEDATREAVLAKQYAAERALEITDNAVQVLGGHGYIRDHPVEMWLRNARGFATFEGLAIV
ncbi:MAG: acyl-CoA dehydrogenase [Candidatus Binatia bacterium]|nr:MAG: acyl-CoA dehydrogenase [Candidatus Binatia bacterium]